MDILTRADLDDLARQNDASAHVSLFLPTHRLGSEDRTDPVRWKNLLTSTESALADRACGAGRSRSSSLPRGCCRRTPWPGST